MPTHFFNFA